MRVRRLARGLLAIVAGLLLLAVLAVVAAVLVLHTGFGREQVRRQLQTRLGGLLQPGLKLQVGKLHGSVLDGPTIDGLAVTDAQGRTLAATGTVRLDYDLSSLFRHRFHVRKAIIERPVVIGHRDSASGRLDLTQMLKPSEAKSENPWAVAIDRVVVEDGLMVLPRAEGTLSLGGVYLDGGVSIAGTATGVSVARLEASWLERGLRARVAGRAIIGERSVLVRGLSVTLGASHVTVPVALARTDGGTVAAPIDVGVMQSDLFRVAPMAPLIGDAALAGSVSRGGTDRPIEVHLDGKAMPTAGRVKLDARWNPHGGAGAATLSASQLHTPPGVKPAAHLDGFDLRAELEDTGGWRPERVRGQVEAELSGEVQGVRLDRVRFGGRADRGRLEGRFDAQTGRGSLEGTATLRIRGNQLSIEEGHIHGTGDLARLLPARQHASGTIVLDASARGPTSALVVSAKATARGVRVGSAQIGAARLEIEGTGLGRAPRAAAKLEAANVVVGKNVIGGVRASANVAGSWRDIAVRIETGGRGAELQVAGGARVSLRPRATRVSLADLRLITRGLTWTGRGGQVTLTPGGGISVSDVALASQAGRVEIGGDLAPETSSRWRAWRATGKMHLHLIRIDLGQVQMRVFPDRPPITGLVSVDAHVMRRDGELRFDARADADGVVLRAGTPAIDARLQAVLEDGRLRAGAEVRERATGGAAQLSYDMTTPHRVLDAAAWRGVPLEDRIRVAKLELASIDLATVGRMVGQNGLRGLAGGTVIADPHARRVVVELGVRGLGIARARLRGLDGALHAAWDARALTGALRFGVEGQALGVLDGTLTAGLHQIVRPASLRAAPLTARLEVRDFPMTSLQRLVRLQEQVSGSLTVTADVSGTPLDPRGRLHLFVDQAVMSGVAFERLSADGGFDERAVSLEVHAAQKQGGDLDATAEYGRQARTLAARVQAHRFDLGFISSLSTQRDDALAGVGGRLDADLSVQRAAGAPASMAGQLQIHDGRFHTEGGVRAIDRLELAAHLDGARLVIDKLSGRSDPGTVTANGELALQGIMPRRLQLAFKLDRFPVNAGSMVVGVDVDGQLSGEAPAGPNDWQVRAKLNSTEVHLPDRSTGGHLEKTSDPPDVIFVDARRSGKHEESAGAPFSLRLLVDTAGGVAVSGKEANAQLRTSGLEVLLRGGELHVGGGIETLNGFVTLFGRRWDIDRADLSFDVADPATDPRLDISLSHEFRTTTVYVAVTGTVLQPKLQLSADPGIYDQAQLLSWVLGGDPDDPSVGKTALDQKAVGVASNLVLGEVQNQIKEALPLDVFSVQVGEGSSPTTTRVEFGKWLTDSLFFGYTYRMNSPENKNVNEADIEYRIARQWLFDAFYGDRGIGSADLLWSKKF
jgi:autotransporter translocation and assembly factor TamB